MPMTILQVHEVLDRCKFPGYSWRVRGDFTDAQGPAYLQACFMADCAFSGVRTPQSTRKWLLSEHMTTSELVQTAFKCVLTSLEHEAREQFTYRGQNIFGPHFNVEALVDLRKANLLEVRA
jgi:hypothetical protein